MQYLILQISINLITSSSTSTNYMYRGYYFFYFVSYHEYDLLKIYVALFSHMIE